METEARQSFSIRDFLHVIFKRKAGILLFFGMAVCTVAVGSFNKKHTYEATALILIKVGRENIYVPEVPTGGGSGPIITRKNQVVTEMEILTSLHLAEKVVEALGPGLISGDAESPPSVEEEAADLRDEIDVDAIEDSDVIEVSYEHEDPEIAARVVNTLVDLYLERHLEIYKSPGSHEFFWEQTQILEKRTKNSEERLEAFKNEHDLTALDEEQSLLLRHEADLRTELNKTLSQEAEVENRIQQLRDQRAKTPKTIPLHLNDETMENLHAKLVQLELQEHEFLTKYSDHSRFVERVRDEIEMVRRKLAEHKAEILQEEILRYKAELQAFKAKEESQRAHLANYLEKHEKLNRIEMEFTRLQQKVEIHRQNYRLYLSKFEESRISDAMDKEKIANVSVIEPAKPPLKPESRGIRQSLMLAAILGAGGGLGLALFSEYLEDSLERDEDVENYLRLPVLASIPELKG